MKMKAIALTLPTIFFSSISSANTWEIGDISPSFNSHETGYLYASSVADTVSNNNLGITMILACVQTNEAFRKDGKIKWDTVKGLEAQVLFDKSVGYLSDFYLKTDVKIKGKTSRKTFNFQSNGFQVEPKFLLKRSLAYEFANYLKNGEGKMRMSLSENSYEQGILYTLDLIGSSKAISKVLKECPESEYKLNLEQKAKQYDGMWNKR